jgi:glycosyltransferase involved in cell wall biosynthesis
MKENDILELSIILPCLNEEKSIGLCLKEISEVIKKNSLKAEVLVIDNGSTDKTIEEIKKYQNIIKNLRIIIEEKQGYGNSCLSGFNNAIGKIFFIADADYTYNFSEITNFIKEMRNGAEMVVGNRFSNGIKKESMSWHHRYIGNPFLSFLVKLFFKVKINDIHCGARAIRKESFKRLTLYTSGMEFASEMIIKAAKAGLKIKEIPIDYRPRIGNSKLNSISDGWRHLRFILLYSPFYLFLLPGIVLFLLGILPLSIFYITEPKILGLQFYIHPMFLFAIMTITGYQLIIFSGFAKIYAITHLGEKDVMVEKMFKKITLENTSIVGIILATLGLIIYISIFLKWLNSDFGSLNETKSLILALVLTVIGIQTFFSAFMFSILGIKEK